LERKQPGGLIKAKREGPGKVRRQATGNGFPQKQILQKTNLLGLRNRGGVWSPRLGEMAPERKLLIAKILHRPREQRHKRAIRDENSKRAVGQPKGKHFHGTKIKRGLARIRTSEA